MTGQAGQTIALRSTVLKEGAEAVRSGFASFTQKMENAARDLSFIGEGMSTDKPTGDYVEEMTSKGAWPEADETAYSNRAGVLTQVLTGVSDATSSWDENAASIFNSSDVWGGSAAAASEREVGSRSQSLAALKTDIDNAIRSHQDAATAIGDTKRTVVGVIGLAHKIIDQVRDYGKQVNEDSTAAEHQVVNTAWKINKGVVDTKALSYGGQPGPQQAPPFPDDELGSSDDNGSSTSATESTADTLSTSSTDPLGVTTASYVPESPAQKATQGAPTTSDVVGSTREGTAPPTPPPPEPKTEVPPVSEDALGETAEATVPAVPTVVTPPPPGAGKAPSPPLGSVTQDAVSPAGLRGSDLSGTAGSPLAGPTPSSSLSGTSSPSDSPLGDASATTPTQTGQTPSNPVEAFIHGYAEAEPSVNPASAGGSPAAPAAPATAPVAPDPTNTSTQAAGHNASTNSPSSVAPVGQAAPSAPLNPGSPMTGGGMGGMPLAPPPTVSPAAPPPMAPPPVAPPPAAAAAAAAPTPVPVSAARRERDAIAAAGRRGNDPAQLARRIAAALNAVPTQDFGFYWVTALTVDGTIVVANSYGIGFIPEGVNLPEQVKMASADESIPAADRGKWATYPMLSLKGWAEQHSTALRIVIATESQLQGFDPGAAKMVLQPDDIPENGQMQGRSRLEVIAPGAAAQLAAVSDAALHELLPVASADLTPPADETFQKWFNVMKPMMSQSDERGRVHLKAFIEYANYAQERALYAAHTAADALSLRAAIADWIYWQHLGVLTSDALSELQPS